MSFYVSVTVGEGVLGIRGLAQSLGISVTTVSKAMHGYADVAPETRERVRNKAREIGYSANTAARNLRSKKTEAILAVMPSDPGGLGPPLMMNLVAGIGEHLARSGLDLLLISPRAGQSELDLLERMVTAGRADGLLLFRTRHHDPRVELLKRRGVPFITHGRTASPEGYAYIDGDGAAGFHSAAGRLIKAGRQRLAFLAGPPEMNFAQLRLQGFSKAMANAGLVTETTTETSLTEIGGYAATAQLLKARPAIDALVCCTDAMAVGALRAVREAGRVPGQDIAIIGHDNAPNAAFCDPPLSTMEIEAADLAASCAASLVALIGGASHKDHQTVFPIRQLVRQTG